MRWPENRKLACGPTWWLALAETAYDQGEAEVTILAEDAASGQPSPGLAIAARPDMDGMSHAHDVEVLTDLGDGSYVGSLEFDMAGLWSITGYVADDVRSEAFTFVVEVQP